MSNHKEYCKDCGGELEKLPTTQGDPEGIRKDRICKDCGMIWGTSKAGFFRIR